MKEESMCTSTFIKRHILELPKGMIFSTREMLNYGKRSAVDQCLYRLVKMGRIIRLTWGMFMKDDSSRELPSPLTVAMEKARAFGRRISQDAVDAAKILALVNEGNKNITYATDGHSTSFKYGQSIIHLRGLCARKMSLGDDPVGLAIKALWQLGRKHCGQNTLAIATRNFTRQDRLQFNKSCGIMPAWMTNLFKR
jgi:Family of unknown function (DUF6088)